MKVRLQICPVPVEVQEAAVAALAADPAAVALEVAREAVSAVAPVPVASVVPVPVASAVLLIITIIAHISVGASVRDVITVAAEDASAR